MWVCGDGSQIYEIPQNFHCDSMSHVNVTSSDVTQVSSIFMDSWVAALSQSGGCRGPSWVFSCVCSRASESCGEDKLIGSVAAAAPAVSSPSMRAGCRHYFLTSNLNCIYSDLLFKSPIAFANFMEDLLFSFQLPVECWVLVQGWGPLNKLSRESLSPLCD